MIGPGQALGLLLVLAALLGAIVWSAQVPRPVPQVVVTLAALAWLLVNAPVEGPTLLHVTPDHGLTVADLPAVAALALAAGQVVRLVRRRR